MTEEQLNQLAYSFVQKVQEIKDEEPIKDRVGSSGHLPFIDLSDKIVEGPIIKRTLNRNLSNFKITTSIKGIDYGFSDLVYKDFFQLINDIQLIEFFKQSVSFEFIEENTLQWIVNVYLNDKSTVELLNHLKDKSQAVIEKQRFYFPVLNLHIHKPFKIGQVELTFFTKDYFDRLWDSYKGEEKITKEEFEEHFRKYQGRVFASYDVTAESKRGKEIAFSECSLAIDALRCFSMTTFLPNRECYMDLSERININYQTDYISIPAGKELQFKTTLTSKNDPFIITGEFYEHILKTGLQLFSEKIKSHDKDELSMLIIQSIELYSYCISTFDLHLRITQLVTIFESLLLEEDRKYKLEEFMKKRLKNLLGKVNMEIQEPMLDDMYQIRHKMVHKAIRLPIDMAKLREFQIITIETIKQLCQLSKTIKDKETLINYLTQN